jgi:hypothetical protein
VEYVVITRVDDNGQVFRRQDKGQAEGQLRASNTTSYSKDFRLGHGQFT